MQIRPSYVAPFVVTVLLLDLVLLAVRVASRGDGDARPLATVGSPPPPAEAAVPAGSTASAGATGERPIPPAPERFDGALPPGAGGACAPRPGPPPSGGTWALIIGINDYPGSGHDLVSSLNDARDVEQALARYGVPADHRLMLLDGEASACGIESGLRWLVDRAAPDSTAVVFYAGHGRKLGDGSRTLVAADGGLFTDHRLGAGLAGLKAGRAWITLATCFGGGFTQVLGPNRILTAAAGGDSLAYESLGFRRSYLVEYMVRRAMLDGAAPGSVESAYAYAQAAIAAAHPGREPVQFDNLPGDLVLGPAPAPVARAAPPPVAPPPPAAPAPAPSRPPVVTTTTRPCRPVLLLFCTYD